MRARWLRIAASVAVCAAAAFVWASISRVPTLELRLESFSGEPQPWAYIAYRYQGSRFNFVDSLSYWRRGEVTRSDAEGHFVIPGFFEWHPPLDSGLDPYVEWIYVPGRHHVLGFGRIREHSEGVEGRTRIDIDAGVLQIADFGDDPVRWSQSIDSLESEIRRLDRAEGADTHASEAVRDELRTHLRAEFTAFMARHADTPRESTESNFTRSLSPEERGERERNFAESLRREPHWGDLMTRIHRDLATP